MSWILRTITSFGKNTSTVTASSNRLVGVLTTFRVPDEDNKGVWSLVCPKDPCSRERLLGQGIFFSFPTNTGGIVDVCDTLTSELMFRWMCVRWVGWYSPTLFVLWLLYSCHFLNRLPGGNDPLTGTGSNRWSGSPVHFLGLSNYQSHHYGHKPNPVWQIESVDVEHEPLYYETIKRELNRRLKVIVK